MSNATTGGGAARLPPHAVSGPASEVSRLMSEAASLAAAGDHAGICVLLSAATARHPSPQLLMRLVEAAFMAGDMGGLRQAASRAIAADLPGRARASIAWQFMRGDWSREAYAVLTADPAIFQDVSARRQVIAVLNGILRSAVAPAELRWTAGALVRRILRVDDSAWSAAPFRFAEQRPVVPAPLACIGLDPEVPASAADVVLRTLKQAERQHLQLPAPAGIRIYADVFVNRAGQVWRRDGVMVRSNGIPLLQESVSAALDRAPSIEDGVLATGDTANFNHWFANWIPNIAWRFEPGVPDLPILIRDDAPSFQARSLRLLGGPQVPLAPVGAAVFVRRLYVTPHGTVRIDADGAGRGVMDRLAVAGDADDGTPAAERIFISRRDSRRRRPANEDEIEAVFVRQGFIPVMLSTLDLVDQIRVVRRASVIAGAHGAGLTLLFAARPGARAYEILPYMPATLPVRLCMARMSRMFGHRHRLWIAPCDERTETWSTDAVALEGDLCAFLSEGARSSGGTRG